MLIESSKILAKAVENGKICRCGNVYFLPGYEELPHEKLRQSEILKDSNTTTCGEYSGIFIKQYNRKGFWKSLKRFFGYPRAYKCLAVSLLLEEMPLLTPKVLHASRYYLVTEMLGDSTYFIVWEPEKVSDFLPFLARLHEGGIAHGDLSLRNIYFDRDSGKYGLIDFDGVIIKRTPLSRKERSWELARVLSSCYQLQELYGKKVTLAGTVEEYLPSYEEASGMTFSRNDILKQAKRFLKH